MSPTAVWPRPPRGAGATLGAMRLRLWVLALVVLLPLRSEAQRAAPVAPVAPVGPVPIGPHGAYFSQLRLQAKALLSMPVPLSQAFGAALLPAPAVRTPAAFAARAALVGALARPGGLHELAEAVEEQEGPKAEKAASALRTLAQAVAAAPRAERSALGAQARALETRFDGAAALPGERVELSAIPTDEEAGPGPGKARRRMKEDRRELSELSEMLAAGKARGVLVVLQGMDSAGKGGATKRPLRLNPAWTRVAALKKPTEEEAARPFLERIEAALPQGKPEGVRGFIQILDRSHYEDLVMPAILGTHTETEIESRYRRVLQFERRLGEAGVVVVKVFFHVSEKEQGRRLRARIDAPEKRYKASTVDWEMRKRFPEFQRVWGEVLARTSAPWSIWNVIAADDKPRRDADLANLVLKTLKRMGLSWPENPELDAVKIAAKSSA